MRTFATAVLTMLSLSCAIYSVRAQQSNSCKMCGDQQRACMKNYAGPTCKAEYQICMKSCAKK
jgi:hypothetical protein